MLAFQSRVPYSRVNVITEKLLDYGESLIEENVFSLSRNHLLRLSCLAIQQNSHIAQAQFTASGLSFSSLLLFYIAILKSNRAFWPKTRLHLILNYSWYFDTRIAVCRATCDDLELRPCLKIKLQLILHWFCCVEGSTQNHRTCKALGLCHGFTLATESFSSRL